MCRPRGSAGQIDVDASGAVVASSGPAKFGDKANKNFRAVFDDRSSSDSDETISDTTSEGNDVGNVGCNPILGEMILEDVTGQCGLA